MVTTSRDKKLRIWDVRQERAAHEVPGHSGAKNSRAVWMGEHNRIATTGFSKMSDRQMALWDVGSPSEPIGGFEVLDSISGVCMPFWDDGTQCLYLAGKGDGNIRYFEYENDKFEFLSEYKSGDPQRGLAFMPRRGINVSIRARIKTNITDTKAASRERGHESIQDGQRCIRRANLLCCASPRRSIPSRHLSTSCRQQARSLRCRLVSR